MELFVLSKVLNLCVGISYFCFCRIKVSLLGDQYWIVLSPSPIVSHVVALTALIAAFSVFSNKCSKIHQNQIDKGRD